MDQLVYRCEAHELEGALIWANVCPCTEATRLAKLVESHAMLAAAVEQLCGHLEEQPDKHQGCTDFGQAALQKARALVPEAK